MGFRIGQEVVCINADKFPRYPRCTYPKEGVKYVVREIDPNCKSGCNIRLCKIINPKFTFLGGPLNKGGDEPSWRPDRFRPLVITDINIFTRMLTSKEFENV